MKTIKQLREQQLIAKLHNTDDKIQGLVNEGLLDENKVALLKRALKKEDTKLSNAEHRILKEMFNILASNQLDELAWKGINTDRYTKFDDRFGQSTKSPYQRLSGYSVADAPMILVLKRKAIRVFPDNVKVAVYYSRELDKYISVPFNEIGISEMTKWSRDAYVTKKKKIAASQLSARDRAEAHRKKMRDQLKRQSNKEYVNSVKSAKHLTLTDKQKDKDIIGHKAQNYDGSAAEKLAWKIGARVGRKVAIARKAYRDARDAAVEKGRKEKGLDEGFDAFRMTVHANRMALEEGLVDTITKKAKEYGSGLAKTAMKGVGAAAGGAAMGLAAAGANAKSGFRNTEKDDDADKEKKSSAVSPKTDDSTDNSDENVRNPHERADAIEKEKLEKKTAKNIAQQTKAAMKENILDKLKTIKEDTMIHYPDKVVIVNKSLAERILETYNNLNTKNKQMVEQMLQTDSVSFRKIVNFISRYQ